MLAINDIHSGRSYRFHGYRPRSYEERLLFKVSNISIHTKITYLVDFMVQNVVLHKRYIVSHVGVVFWLIWARLTIKGV